MKEMKSKLVKTIWNIAVLALLFTWAIPAETVRAQDSPTPLVAVAEALGAIANDPLGQAELAIWELLTGVMQWDQDIWDNVIAIKNQFGVAMDALIPSVSGCITEPDETPIENVLVVGTSKVFFDQPPVIGTTGGQAIGATFVILAPGPALVPTPIPVLRDWLSDDQEANWAPTNGVGCYWLPIPPGLMQGAVGALLAGVTGELRQYTWLSVFPYIPGYSIVPGYKEIVLLGDSYYFNDGEMNYGGGTAD